MPRFGSPLHSRLFSPLFDLLDRQDFPLGMTWYLSFFLFRQMPATSNPLVKLWPGVLEKSFPSAHGAVATHPEVFQVRIPRSVYLISSLAVH